MISKDALIEQYRHVLFGMVCDALRSSLKESGQLGLQMDMYRIRVNDTIGQIWQQLQVQEPIKEPHVNGNSSGRGAVLPRTQGVRN